MIMSLVNIKVQKNTSLKLWDSHVPIEQIRTVVKSKVVDVRQQHHVYPLHPHWAFLTLTHTEYNSRNSHRFHVCIVFYGWLLYPKLNMFSGLLGLREVLRKFLRSCSLLPYEWMYSDLLSPFSRSEGLGCDKTHVTGYRKCLLWMINW